MQQCRTPGVFKIKVVDTSIHASDHDKSLSCSLAFLHAFSFLFILSSELVAPWIQYLLIYTIVYIMLILKIYTVNPLGPWKCSKTNLFWLQNFVHYNVLNSIPTILAKYAKCKINHNNPFKSVFQYKIKHYEKFLEIKVYIIQLSTAKDVSGW